MKTNAGLPTCTALPNCPHFYFLSYLITSQSRGKSKTPSVSKQVRKPHRPLILIMINIPPLKECYPIIKSAPSLSKSPQPAKSHLLRRDKGRESHTLTNKPNIKLIRTMYHSRTVPIIVALSELYGSRLASQLRPPITLQSQTRIKRLYSPDYPRYQTPCF
jgi:hypothetical protein